MQDQRRIYMYGLFTRFEEGYLDSIAQLQEAIPGFVAPPRHIYVDVHDRATGYAAAEALVIALKAFLSYRSLLEEDDRSTIDGALGAAYAQLVQTWLICHLSKNDIQVAMRPVALSFVMAFPCLSEARRLDIAKRATHLYVDISSSPSTVAWRESLSGCVEFWLVSAAKPVRVPGAELEIEQLFARLLATLLDSVEPV